MKASILSLLVIVASVSLGYAQQYKTTDDTTKLNAEYVKVQNDIVHLTSELAIAQNNLPSYKLKASDAGTDAATSATASSGEASKATNGKLDDSKQAKKRAKQAYGKAKDSRTAARNVIKLEDKITHLTDQLTRKNQRLQDLRMMRAAIGGKALMPELPQADPMP